MSFVVVCFEVLAASYGHLSVAAFMRPHLSNLIFRWIHDLKLDMMQFPVVLCGYGSMQVFDSAQALTCNGCLPVAISFFFCLSLFFSAS
jgi:hypothetical protein